MKSLTELVGLRLDDVYNDVACVRKVIEKREKCFVSLKMAGSSSLRPFFS